MQRDSKGRIVPGTHWRAPRPHWQREWLVREYIEKQRSTGEIAAEIGTSDANVIYWLKKHGIARRSISRARAVKYWGVSGCDNPMHGRTGKANPRYVDGSSPERQRMYVQSQGREFLRSILRRDGYKCQRCALPKAGAKSLHVHHIKPWAGNPELRFDERNVITLCKGCHDWVHSRANEQREFLA